MVESGFSKEKFWIILKSRLFFLWIVFSTLFLGCGGGGGSGAGGTGIDPIEVEVGAQMDHFLAAVSNRETEGAMEFIDSNLKYFRKGYPAPVGYSIFKDHLSNFFSGCSSISIELRDRGVIPGGENFASVRGNLVCKYIDLKGNSHEFLEPCEIEFERVSRWGMRSLSGFNNEGMVFPP